MTKIYLGIDESNHGRIPEIFVGYFSKNINDIKPDAFDKLRHQLPSKSIRQVYTEIVGKNYSKHILFSKEDKELLGEKGMVLVALVEFVKNIGETIDTVIIDGAQTSENLKRIKNQLKPYAMVPSIKAESRADITYPIVHKADYLANILHQYYRDMKNPAKETELSDHLIRPDIEKYRFLFRN